MSVKTAYQNYKILTGEQVSFAKFKRMFEKLCREVMPGKFTGHRKE